MYIPFARSEQVKRLTYFSLPRILNELPDCRHTPNPITFKIAIKWHLRNLVKSQNPISTVNSNMGYRLPPFRYPYQSTSIQKLIL